MPPARRQIGPMPPPLVNKPVELPPGPDDAPEAMILDFLGGLIGNVKERNMPSALGGAATMLPLGKLLGLLGKRPKVPTNIGDMFLREHAMPPLDLDSRITGLPPKRPMPPAAPKVIGDEEIMDRMLKTGGRTTPERRKPK